jgi:hypothetical protein
LRVGSTVHWSPKLKHSVVAGVRSANGGTTPET